MKKSRIIAALVCASIGLTTGAVFAQPSPGGPDTHHDGYRGPGPGEPDHGPHGHEEPHHPDWRKGDRLSADYRDHQYVVDDWRGHHLHQPPRGYQWVGVGADYLLVAVASGVIAQVVMSQ